MEENDVFSIYGRENIEPFVRWSEKDLIEDSNREKFEAPIASLPEYNSLGERNRTCLIIGILLFLSQF